MTEERYTVFGFNTDFHEWWSQKGLTEIVRFEQAEVHHIRRRVREFGKENGFPPRTYEPQTAGTSLLVNPDKGSI